MYGREHLFSIFSQLIVGLLIVRLVTLRDDSMPIDDENFAERNANVHIADSVCLTISKAAVERLLLSRE